MFCLLRVLYKQPLLNSVLKAIFHPQPVLKIKSLCKGIFLLLQVLKRKPLCKAIFYLLRVLKGNH